MAPIDAAAPGRLTFWLGESAGLVVGQAPGVFVRRSSPADLESRSDSPADPRDPWAIPWRLRCAARTRGTKPGRRNQDHVKASDVLAFFSVADGIGGYGDGKRASFLAVEAVHEYLLQLRQGGRVPSSGLVRESFEAVNEFILDEAIRSRERGGMGTVLTSLLLAADEFWVGHVGSGGVWLVRDGEAVRLTRSHTLADEQARAGTITREQAREHPFRKVLSRSLGRRERVPVDILHGAVRADDVFVLATDGLPAAVPEVEIARVVNGCERASEMAWDLIQRAVDAEADDDVTVLVLACRAPDEHPP